MAISIVQISSVAYWSGTNTASPSLSGVSAGNTLLALYNSNNNASNGIVTVNDGSAYAADFSKQQGTYSQLVVGVARLSSAGAGAHTANCVNTQAATYGHAILMEVAGLAAAPLDKTSGNTASSTSPTTGSTGVLSQADELVIAILGGDASLAGWTNPPTGFTNIFNTTGDGFGYTSFSYKIVNATTAQNPGWGAIGSQDWVAACATYKMAAAAVVPLVTASAQRNRRHSFGRPMRMSAGGILMAA